MNLVAAIAAHIKAAQPDLNIVQAGDAADPERLTCHIITTSPTSFVADITGPSFIEATDAAVPVIDALFSTDIASSECQNTASDSRDRFSKTRVGYAHGLILRDAENTPIGYRCVFDFQEINVVNREVAAFKEIAAAA